MADSNGGTADTASGDGTATASGEGDRQFPTLTVGEHEFVILQVAAILGGMGLAISYLLPWVSIVDTAWPAAADGEVPVPEAIEIVQSGSVGGPEIAFLPELIAILGLITAVLSVVWWNRLVHGVVTAVGFAGTGIVLFMREGLQVDDMIIRVGGYEGFGQSFEPAVGMWLALVISALLIGIGFGAFLNSFEE